MDGLNAARADCPRKPDRAQPSRDGRRRAVQRVAAAEGGKMKSAYVVLSLLLIYVPVQAQGPVLSAEGVTEIDGVLQRAVEQGAIPGVVAIVANKDRILYHGAFGLMDVANRKPVQKDSIFRIASMTKPVTSLAVVMLSEQDRLRFDDPISAHLPEFKNLEVITEFNSADGTYQTKRAARDVTIRHLLSNTSGFGYAFSNHTLRTLQEKTGKLPEQLPLLHEPGTRWTYGMSTKLLGQVVEKLSGMRLNEYFGANIFGPLGMQDTFFDVPAGKRDRVVTIHTRTDGKLQETPNPEKLAAPVAGDGGLFSTAGDYVKFLQLLLAEGAWRGRTVLKRASVQAMTKNQIGSVVVETQPAAIPARTNPFPLGAGRDKFGFGFQITASNKENPDLRSPGSYSWAGIYNTHFWVDPRRRIAAVILMQVLPFYDDACIRLYQDFELAIGRNLN
jgi:CubicO group peptidase (beta-lactamase class C family)